ncbi:MULTISPECIES: thiamine diphosphokinase [Staphylococcus]|uniref:Thiamine diphosphokinase n=1 Tax=Staphylococcus schleiferi TaxID=1295 RepID=A0A7Z7QQ47_STASC|nr:MULTISPECIES: thiamine diphosphokinase [Staphylococcus]QGS47308.1 thiamine diphosphokinase [Mammaliicoccus fleurettii]EPD52550.1 thiamine pyrophosphokinase [Staphylococcus sp. HGB0015]MBF1992730.1 thiamine diphosphokinase [Staphylococcus schleiferi]MBF2038356.1 thiamine diphosphokinase [Staphylococcus schleiferi]MBF2100206.1 thiamine diphosphokinase [Staphylococcus schleiferi]
MTKSICLLCSSRTLPEKLLEHHHDQEWAGVDRGTLLLLQHQITPVFAVGDFDSISSSEREWIKSHIAIEPVPAEKADTDLALAVHQAVALGYDDIQIYGATGGRLDHFMGAMALLQNPDFVNKKIVIIDKMNEIEYLTEGRYTIENNESFKYVSFPLGADQVKLSLKGFKYELDEVTLQRGSTLTISNEFIEDKGEVIVHEGAVFLMRSRDE